MNFKSYKILAISIIALLAASCQKEELYPQEEAFSATAVICGSVATKVDYNSDPESNVITQRWSVGDEVFGYDDSGQSFTFEVTSINESSGKATFSLNGYEPKGATKAYAVFYPGKSGFGADGTLGVDLSSQNGILSAETPVLMCATSEIKGNNVEFSFRNQAAVIEVKKFQIEPGKTVSSFEIGGLVATGKFEVVDGEMALVPSTQPGTISASVNLTADADGIVDVPVFFVALETRNANITVAAKSGSTTYDNANSIPVTDVEAGHLYYMSKRLAQVAQVGTATYSSFADAIAACVASHRKQTVSILRDFAESTLIKVPAEGLVLDLAGHDANVRIEVSSELELNDSGTGGRLRYTDANVIKVNAGGKLVMNGGTVQAEYVGLKRSAISILGSASKKAEAVFNGGTVIGNNYRGGLECQYGKVEINGGNFEGYVPITVWRYSDVTINDAHVECTEPSANHGEGIYFCTEYVLTSGADTGSMENVNVLINGGEFIAKASPMFRHANGADVSENAVLDICGGYFTWPETSAFMSAGTKQNIELFVNGGHFSKKEYENFFEEGDWFIPCKFSCDQSGFQTLESAFSYAKDQKKGTVKMFSDWTMAGSVSLASGEYALDLQGHNLTVNSRRINVSGAKLSITSSTGNASYTQATANNYLMSISGGEVTVDKVAFNCESTGTAFYVAPASGAAAKLIVNGGSITSQNKSAIGAMAGSEIEINGGELTAATSNVVNSTDASISITGGTFSSNSTAIYLNGSTASITNGTFESANLNAVALENNAEVTISGGEFTTTTNSTIYANPGKVTITGGNFYSSEKIALSCENGSEAIVEGGTFETGDVSAVWLENSTITVENGTFTSPNRNAIHCEGEEGCAATINGGTFTSGATADNYAGRFYKTALTINGGDFQSNGTSALYLTDCTNPVINGGSFKSNAGTALTVDAYSIAIKDGYFHSTGNNALILRNGANVTIEGGTFISDSMTAVYMTGSVSNTLAIDGGAFICNSNPATLNGTNGYALFAGGSNQNVTVANAVSEPYFFTASTAESPVYRNSTSCAVSVNAGYFNMAKVGAGAQFYDSAHQVIALDPVQTLAIDGTTYSFGWQVVSK